MAAPKSIQAKAIALSKALDRVAKLSSELEEWYAGKTSDEEAQDFFHSYSLDIPWEFNLEETIEALNEASR